MTADDEASDEPVAQALRAWSGSPALVGCSFARHPEKHVRVWNQPIVAEHLDAELSAALTVAAEGSKFAMLAFPLVATARMLADTIRAIAACPGWGLWSRASANPAVESFELLWRMPSGGWSRSLVVGPFPFFPATRRATHTAFLLWPTKRANLLTANKSPVVGIGDAAPRGQDTMTPEAYRESVDAVQAQVAAISAAPGAFAPWRWVSVYLERAEASGLVLSSAADDPRPPPKTKPPASG